jgi:GNAT superfamily N-acetyltransferase
MTQHRVAYEKEPGDAPDWRIPCFYTDRHHRRSGIARTVLQGALRFIAEDGGGTVEAIPEVTEGRKAQGGFLFQASVELFEEFGFTRVCQLGKWTWLVRATIPASARC